jgi:subtilase family serine protease
LATESSADDTGEGRRAAVLPTGGYAQFRVAIDPLSAGDYQIVVQLDADNAISERNEANNLQTYGVHLS